MDAGAVPFRKWRRTGRIDPDALRVRAIRGWTDRAGAQDRLATSRRRHAHGLGQRILATDAIEVPLMELRSLVVRAGAAGASGV